MKMYAITGVILAIILGLTAWTTTQGNIGYILNENHFENEEISFNYFKEWDIIKVNPETGDIVGFRHTNYDAQRNYASGIYVNKVPSKFGSNLEDVYAIAIEQESKISTYKPISNRTLTVDGAKAYEFIFYENNMGDNTKNIDVIVEKNGRVYRLMYVGDPNLFDKEKADFYFIVNNFKIK